MVNASMFLINDSHLIEEGSPKRSILIPTDILRIILLMTVLLSPFISSAQKIAINGIYYRIDDNVAYVSGVDPGITDVVIMPQIKYNGEKYDVTGIDDYAFKNLNQIKSIIIPNSVKAIGYEVFRGCSKLKKLIMPDEAIVTLLKPNPITPSQALAISPLYGCVSLIDLSGNTIEWPGYFESGFVIVDNVPAVDQRYGWNKTPAKQRLKEAVEKSNSNNITASSQSQASGSSNQNDQSNIGDVLDSMITGNIPNNPPAQTKPASTKKVSQKSIKSLSDYARDIEGEYIGVGVLSKGLEIIERYEMISIKLNKIDRNTVGVNVYENGEIPFFSQEIPHRIYKNGNDYVLINSEVSSATICIYNESEVSYVHPKVEIDGQIYKLDIRVKNPKKELHTDTAANTPLNNNSTTQTIHVVLPDQTLGMIAEKYHVSVQDIKDWNELPQQTSATSKLKNGTELIIFLNN